MTVRGSFPIRWAAEDGKDAVSLDLDNEMDSIACDSSGRSIGSQTIEATACLYVGSDYTLTGVTYSKGVRLNGIASSETVSSGKVTYKWTFPADTLFANSKYTATISFTYNGNTHSKVFTLNAIKAAKEGETPTIYSVLPSRSAIAFSRDSNDALIPSSVSVTCGYVKRTGKETTRVNSATSVFDSEYIICYRYRQGGTWRGYSNYTNSLTIPSSTAYDAIEFIILNSTDSSRVEDSLIVDRETVPIVKSGQKGAPGDDGDPGKDAVSLHCSAPNLIFECNEDGVCTGINLKQVTCVLMKGSAQVADSTIQSVNGKTAAFTSNNISIGFNSTNIAISASTSAVISDITLTVVVSSASLGVSMTCTISVVRAVKGAKGLQGIAGAVLRPRGSYDATSLSEFAGILRNDSTYIDYIRFVSGNSISFYKLRSGYVSWTKTTATKADGTTETAKLPNASTTQWEVFDNLGAVSAAFLIAGTVSAQTTSTCEAFIGTSGATAKEDGTIGLASDANGWAINGGQIRHTKTGLTLTADGRIYDPDGLHLSAGNNTLSVRPNLAKEALWRTGSPFTGATGSTGIAGTVEVVDNLGDTYSPWAGDRGRILAMYLTKLLSTGNNNLFNAVASLPQKWYGMKLEAGKTYTLSVWVKVGCPDMLVSNSDVAEVRQYASLSSTTNNGYKRVYMQAGDMVVAGWRQCSLTVTGNANYPYLSWIPLCHISENLIPNPVLCDKTSGGSYVAHPYSSAAGVDSGISATISVTSSNTANPWYKDGGRVVSVNVSSNSCSSVGSVYAQFASTANAPVAVTAGAVYRFSVWASIQGSGNVPSNGVIGELDFYTSTSNTTIVSRTYVKLTDYVRDEANGFKLYSVAVTVPSGAGAARWRPCVQVAAGKSGFTVAWAGARLSKGSDIKGMLFGGMSDAYIAYAGFKVEEGDKPSAMTYGAANALLNAGIDITTGEITFTADKFTCQNLKGEKTAYLDDTGSFISAGVQMSMVNYLHWSNNVGRDKLIVICNGTYNGKEGDVAWLGNDEQWRDFNGNIIDIDNVTVLSYVSYLDVLRIGSMLIVESLPTAAKGTSGNDQKQINLPYYIDSYNNERGYTRFGNHSNSIPRLMKADEMRMLEGKRITIRFGSNIGTTADYTQLSTLFSFLDQGNDRDFFNGVRYVQNPKDDANIRVSFPINPSRVISVLCNFFYFKAGLSPSCAGYAWTYSIEKGLASSNFGGLDSWT